MKKLFAAVLSIGIIASALAGCGYQDALDAANSKSSSSAVSKESESTKEVKPEEYSKNLGGLIDYFADLGYLEMKDNKLDESKVMVMNHTLIGAKEGKKFATTVANKPVYIELYEFDKKPNDTALSVIRSVEETGQFQIINLDPVKAYVSENEQFLMIYSDASIDDSNPDKTTENYVNRNKVIESFDKFN